MYRYVAMFRNLILPGKKNKSAFQVVLIKNKAIITLKPLYVIICKWMYCSYDLVKRILRSMDGSYITVILQMDLTTLAFSVLVYFM